MGWSVEHARWQRASECMIGLALLLLALWVFYFVVSECWAQGVWYMTKMALSGLVLLVCVVLAAGGLNKLGRWTRGQ